ncbi:hypothetical protein T4B_13886 [Trichinella pseudospiralis]|uniref:Uncharacterized protein n=1 Tax=Trichinella pseudospiralis TaxID=6337 RepID=A0A0V1GP87_TRIPS|nr:hypothetical protein T4B_13886 [Trichinella pseudospiralis]
MEEVQINVLKSAFQPAMEYEDDISTAYFAASNSRSKPPVLVHTTNITFVEVQIKLHSTHFHVTAAYGIQALTGRRKFY